MNGKPQKEIPGIQFKYLVQINGTSINKEALEKLDISTDGIEGSDSQYKMSLTVGQAKKLGELKFIRSIERIFYPADEKMPEIFPSDPKYTWNLDNFGPIWIPKKGVTINLTVDNLPVYKRLIEIYEGNKLQVNNNQIIINGSHCHDLYIQDELLLDDGR